MTNEEAKEFLSHYICSCQYGTSPTDCDNDKCKFGIAIRTLCDEERPQGKGKWIKIEPETRGYAEFFRCSHCLYNIQLAYWDNECDYDYCPNCGARMETDNDSKRTY